MTPLSYSSRIDFKILAAIDFLLMLTLSSAGSRIRFMIPMVPWLAINFYYAYRGNDRHWYSMDF
jgi:hypothetical protein